jgi:hypothetical protein
MNKLLLLALLSLFSCYLFASVPCTTAANVLDVEQALDEIDETDTLDEIESRTLGYINGDNCDPAQTCIATCSGKCTKSFYYDLSKTFSWPDYQSRWVSSCNKLNLKTWMNQQIDGTLSYLKRVGAVSGSDSFRKALVGVFSSVLSEYAKVCHGENQSLSTARLLILKTVFYTNWAVHISLAKISGVFGSRSKSQNEELAQEKAKEIFDLFGDYAKEERFGYCPCSSYTRINTRISGLFNLTHQMRCSGC